MIDAEDFLPSGWRGWPRELTDQALHFGWAFATAWLACLWWPWSTLLALGSLACIILREIDQWPPAEDRPWDPYADWTFFALGAVGGLGVGL